LKNVRVVFSRAAQRRNRPSQQDQRIVVEKRKTPTRWRRRSDRED
jgi:hypothetical protein